MARRDLVTELLDTVPGRLFLTELQFGRTRAAIPSCAEEFTRSLPMSELVESAQRSVRTYSYGDGLQDALKIDPKDTNIQAMAFAVAAELSAPHRSTFTSPQRHSGNVTSLRVPAISNRKSTDETLPAGALWTATPLGYDRDTWTYSRESNDPFITYELHFEPADVRVALIDSAEDWRTVVAAHPRGASSTLRPDWTMIAEHYGAVHLSLRGLLTAHPSISSSATDRTCDSYSHSMSGSWAGVAHWSTVSTAWMTLPDNRRWVFPVP